MNKLISGNIFVTIVLLLISTFSFAQPANLEGDWNNGSWSNSNALTDRGVVRAVRVQATGTANRNFLFNTASANYNPQWTGSNAPNFVRSLNTLHSGGAFYYTSGGWNTNLQISATNSNYYTFIIGENSASNNNVSILETSYNPRTITGGTVTQSPITTAVYAEKSVTVSATLSNTLQSGEYAYIRYSTDNWATSQLVSMSLASGTIYSGTIPGQNAAITVRYYVLTSNSNSFAAADADYFTLAIDNNSGSNYSYVVATTYFSNTSNTANTLGNWKPTRAGTGTSPSNFTTSGNVFVVEAADSMWSGSTWTLGSGVRLVVENGGILRQNSTININAAGTFQLDEGAKYYHNSSSGSSISAGTEAWHSNSTIIYLNTGIISTANITGSAHPNVVIRTGGNLNPGGILTNIGGNLSVEQSGSNSFNFTGSVATTVTVAGNITVKSGVFSFANGTASPAAVNLAGNFTVESGATFTYSGSAAGGADLNFTKSGTQTFTNSGTIAATKVDYTVNSGSTIDVGTSIIPGTGTFTVSSGGGIITANTNATGALTSTGSNGSIQVTNTRSFSTSGNYTFNGASAQVAGNGFVGAANLTLNNSGGLTLSAAVPVTGTLALTSGKLTLGANDLTLTGATVTGASSSNYIVTNSTGRVIRNHTGSFVYPVGTSTNYTPLTINNTGSAQTYTIGSAATTFSPSSDGAVNQWSVAASGSSSTDLTFGWYTADAGANLSASPSSGKAFRYNGSTWDDLGGSTSTGTPNTTAVTGITSFTNTIWTVAMPAAAPDIALADNSGGQVGATNVDADANTTATIYNFQTAVTTANATINSVTFNTTNSASDVTNYKLLYATTNSFGSATQIGSNITTSLGTGSHTFSGLTQVTNSGSTGYFWITADVPSTATAGNTIVVSAITTGDLTYASGNKTGTTSAGGTQTIIKSPTVTTGSATNISTTDADLDGTVNANAATTTGNIQFEYGTSVSYGTNVNSSPSSASGTSNTSVSATAISTGTLTPNTEYHYRLTATNAAGTTNGSDATFTTLPNPPTISGTNNTDAQTSAGATIFTAHWTAPVVAGSATYQYSIEVNDDITFTNAAEYTESGISSVNLTASVIGLSPGTTYYYRVKTTNVSGAQSSTWSSTSAGILTTSPTVPVVGTTDAISVYTTTTADGGGAITTDGGATITARGLVYNTSSPAETGGTLFPESGTSTGTFTDQITGLSQNTLYYVKAYATNSVGTGYSSTEQSFTTLKTEPNTNGSLTYSPVADVTMTVDFAGGNGDKRIVIAKAGSAPTFTPTDITNYTGADADFSSAPALGDGKLVFNGSGTSVNLTGLVKNTTYHFLVYEYSENSASVANYYATGLTGSQATKNPTITKVETGFTSNFGNAVVSTSTGSDNFTVSGTELVSDITVTAPTGFEVSDDDATWVSTFDITPSGGTVTNVPVYVRFSPGTANGANSGNVALTATSATTVNVGVSGNAIDTEPTTQSTITFGTVTATTIVVNLPSAGDGDKRIVLVKSGSAVDADPVDGTTYTASTVFGSGSEIGTGNFVAYANNGSGSSVFTVTGLTSGVTYHFAVYDYNENTGTSQNYLITSPGTGNETAILASAATDYFRSITTANWNATTTWESSTDGSTGWHASTLVPDATATLVTIRSGDNVTYSGTPSSIGNTTVASGGTLTTSSAYTVASTKTLTVSSGGTLDYTANTAPTITGSLVISGTYKINPGTPSAQIVPSTNTTYNSTCDLQILNVSVSTDNIRIPVSIAGTVTWNANPASGGAYTFLNASGLTIGNLVIINTGSRPISHGTGGTGRNLTISADLNIQGGEYYPCGSPAGTGNTSTLTVNGDLIQSGGTLAANNSTSGSTSTNPSINLKGDITISGGTLTGKTSTGPGILRINGSSAQTITASGTYTIGDVTTANTSGGISLSSNATITGNLTQTSSTLTVGANTLTLGGNVTTGGGNIDASNASATVVLAGAAAQTLTGSIFTGNVNNLTINNSNGVTLGASTAITVANTLAFTSGKIDIGANTLTIGSSGSITGASSSNFVITSGVGSLKRNGVGATSTDFPVGNLSSSYTPLTISNSGTTNDLSVRSSATITNAVSDPSAIVTLQWTVNSGGAGAVGDITYNWNGANQAGSFNASGLGELGVYTSGPYTTLSLGTLSGGTSVTKTGVTLASGNNLMVVGNKNAVYVPQLFGWDMSGQPGGTNNFGTTPLAYSTTTTGISVGSLTRSAGVSTTGTGAARGWGGTGWDNGGATSTAADNIANNKFFTFTVTPNSGYSLDLVSINPFDYRRSGTGPSNALVQYSINGGTYTDIGTLTFSSSSSSGAQAGSTSLSSISALQNVQSISTVTFRIVPYGTSSSAGTFYIYDFAVTSANDLAVNGTVSSCISTSATPVVDPICAGGTTVTGTSSEANGTLINVYLNGNYTVPATTATVSSGVWSATTASALTAGTTVTAYATASGKCVSTISSTVTVVGAPDVATAGVDQNICDGSAATLAANDPTVGTGSWSIVSGSTSENTSQFASLSTYNTTFTPDGGVGTYTLVWTIASSPCTASTDTVVINVKTTGQWVGPNTGGDWLTGANWCGGVPSSSSSVTIPSGVTINVSSGNISIKDITIDAGGSLVMTGAHNINISSGGTITNNGTFDATGSTTGAVVFAGTGTVSGTITFENVTISNGVDFGTASTIGDGGTLTLNAGGYIDNSHPPIYHCNSTLKYNINATYGRFNEWTTATSGPGYPGNVLLTNNTVLNLPNGSGSARAMCGNLTIDAGSALYMDYSGGSLALQVGGDITANGNLSLGGSAGGDLKIGGDFTVGSSATINYKNRAFEFNGTGTQVVTKTSSALTVPYLLINKASGNVQLATGTDIILSTTSGNVLQFLNSGGLDLNGQKVTLSNTNGNILVNGNSSIVGTTGSNIDITGNKTISGSGTLGFGSDVLLSTSAGINFGSGIATVNGTFRINAGGYVAGSNPPTYGTGSTLQYYSNTSYGRDNEWNATSGAGYPYNVQISNNTTLQLGNGSTGTGRSMAGSLTIDNGSALTMASPAMTAGLTVGNNVTIDGTLTLSSSAGGDILVGGNWTRNSSGTFTHNSRNVTFNSSNKTIVTAPASNTRNSVGAFGGETFYRLFMSKTNATDSVRLASNIAVINELGFVKGAFDCNVGDVTIVSNRNITARVSPILNVGDVTVDYSDTGKFIIHRFLPIDPWSSARRWRLLTAPVSSSSTNDLSISRAWQEGAKNTTLSNLSNPQPGYGITITNGNTGAAVANGFDMGNTASPSMYYMVLPGAPLTWLAPTNTTTTKITDYEGFMTFVRGHRGIGVTNQWAVPDTTTLATKGRINIGDVTKTIDTGYQVIGNPYPSAINFNNVNYNGITPGTTVGATYYLWDPKTPGAYNVGQWITFSSRGDGKYDFTPTPVSDLDTTGLIESGAAFLINSASAGTLVIHETDKRVTSSTVGIASRPSGTSASPIPKIAVNMYLKNSDGTRSIMDGASVSFDAAFNDIVDGQDSKKASTFTSRERVSILRDAVSLAIERRKTMDTVALNIVRINTADHILEITSSNFDGGIQAYLTDKHLNTETPLIANGTLTYDFLTTGVEANDLNRFSIVFRPIIVVPVKYTTVKAFEKTNQIAVEWKVENEVNTQKYIIEKSKDGVNFASVATLAALSSSGATASYSWLDVNPINGDNYYRIVSISAAGSTIGSYSQVVKVKIGKTLSTISVYPNPIVDGNIGLQLINIPKGTYSVRVLNSLGQLILNKNIQHFGGVQQKPYL